MLLTLGVTVGAYLRLVTPAHLRGEGGGGYALNGQDYFVYAGQQALRLAEAPSGTGQALIVLGSSATRAVLAEDTLPALLNPQAPPALYNLCTNGQTLFESIVYARDLHAMRAGTLILGIHLAGPAISPQRRQWTRDLFPFHSPWLTEQLRMEGLQPPRETGYYALDHLGFFMPRLPNVILATLTGRSPEYQPNPYIDSPPHPRWRLVRQAKTAAQSMTEQAAAYAQSYALLDTFLAELPQRLPGMKVLLLNEPINPWFVEAYALQNRLQDHRQRLQAMAVRHGLAFLDLSREEIYGADDYRDWTHIRGRVQMDRASRLIHDVWRRQEAGSGYP